MMSRLASSTAKRFLSTATTSSSASSSSLPSKSSSSSSSYSSSSLSSSRFSLPSRLPPSFQLPSRRHLSAAATPATSDSTVSSLKSFAQLQPNSLAGYPNTRISTLPNGLRVASEASGGHTATVGVWMDIGSRFEKAEDNGVAHFLEHLAFKGTPSRNRVQLESEIENMGGHLNAYTSREQSVYHAKVFAGDVSKAFEILSDILKNSKLDSDDINRERDVILREMQEVDANLSEVIFDRLHETAYRGTPLARTILGSVENIRSINQAQLKKYIGTHYTAPHMVIAGAGGVQHEELVRLAEKYFGDVPKEPTNGIPPVLAPARFTGSDIRVRNDELHEAHVAIAFETAGWTDPDNFPLMIIQTLLGSWDLNVHGGQHSSSELVSAVAEHRMANRYTTFNTQYSDTGLFGVYFIAEPVTLFQFTNTFLASLVKLAREVDPVRLEEAKTLLKMTMLGHMDGNAQVAEDIGRQLLVYGRRLHPVEIIARIDAIDENAIKNTVQRFFWDRDFALAAIGPIFELPDYNWIRARTYSLLY